jgi:hypothetical protein
VTDQNIKESLNHVKKLAVAALDTATKITELPALTADLLQSNSCLVDNLFADLWKQTLKILET